MRIFQNDTDEDIQVTYIVDPAHYEDGHSCAGTCASVTRVAPPGSRISFEETQANWVDIQANLSNLVEVS